MKECEEEKRERREKEGEVVGGRIKRKGSDGVEDGPGRRDRLIWESLGPSLLPTLSDYRTQDRNRQRLREF